MTRVGKGYSAESASADIPFVNKNKECSQKHNTFCYIIKHIVGQASFSIAVLKES